MYLAKLEIENFRAFGSKADNAHLCLELSPGLNLLVGENDSGKTCVIDAIRLVLGTTPTEYNPLTVADFHCRDGKRVSSLSIAVEIGSLSEAESAAFLEYADLIDQNGTPTYRLRVVLTATLKDVVGRGSRRSPVEWEIRAGPDHDAPRLEGSARDLLRATYLKPLRDALSELAAKRGSRLSQILQSYQQLEGQEQSDFDEQDPESKPTTLVGFMHQAEHSIRKSTAINAASSTLNDSYLKPFSIGRTPLRGQIGIPAQELRHVLERLELTLVDHEPGSTRGLGHHNVLFMAAELLAVERDNDPCLPLVLIEEPEAHLHPQLQVRLVEFFRKETSGDTGEPRLQVIMTSHSPNIAAKVGLNDIVLMNKGQAYPLRSPLTKLDRSDYAFLERFLDVTRSELLFARGLLIVEGDGEALLLPTLADLIDCSLTANGVSIINVGHTGLFRYARILQRTDGKTMPVKVACIADRDIPPLKAKHLLSATRKTEADFNAEALAEKLGKFTDEDDDVVKTFVSEVWTLEYDLALKGLSKEMHVAVQLASKKRALNEDERKEIQEAAEAAHAGWVAANRSREDIAIEVYKPLVEDSVSKAEAAQYLAVQLRELSAEEKAALRGRLPSYLIAAIEHATGHGVNVDVAPAPIDEGELDATG